MGQENHEFYRAKLGDKEIGGWRQSVNPPLLSLLVCVRIFRTLLARPVDGGGVVEDLGAAWLRDQSELRPFREADGERTRCVLLPSVARKTVLTTLPRVKASSQVMWWSRAKQSKIFCKVEGMTIFLCLAGQMVSSILLIPPHPLLGARISRVQSEQQNHGGTSFSGFAINPRTLFPEEYLYARRRAPRRA